MKQEKKQQEILWVTPLDLLRRKLARIKKEKELQEKEEKQISNFKK